MGLADRDLLEARMNYTTAPKTTTSVVSGAKKTIGATAKGTYTGGTVTSPTAKTAPAQTTYTGAKTQVTAPAPVTGGYQAPQTTATQTQVTETPVQDPHVDEVIADPAGTGGFNDTLQKFTEEDIAAALAAIEAEFGLTREQLMADQTIIGAQYRLMTAQLARRRESALEQTEAGALQRGLFRSGIYAAEAGKVSQEFADAEAQAFQEKTSQELAIEQRLATLEAEKERKKAEEETAIRRGEYTARLQAAGL